jgi:hypothetical protein
MSQDPATGVMADELSSRTTAIAALVVLKPW